MIGGTCATAAMVFGLVGLFVSGEKRRVSARNPL